MEAFATLEDLERGWPGYSDADLDEEVAENLLLRASAFIAAQMRNYGIEVDPDDEVQRINLTTVTCNMVVDAVSRASMDGVASFAQAVGSTNVSVTYRDRPASFFMTAADRDLLGLKPRGKGRMLHPSCDPSEVRWYGHVQPVRP